MLKLLVMLVMASGMRDTGEDAAGALVSALAKRSTSDAVLNAQAIGNARYGLA